MENRYRMPPLMKNSQGQERRVGVEIELTGPKIRDLVDVVESCYPGEVRSVSDYEWEIECPELGTFRIEVDFDLLKRLGRQSHETGDLLDEWAGKALNSLASGLAPLEIVSPPIPLSRLAEMDVLVDQLRLEGAKGSKYSLLHAFGLHLNPEAPALTAESMLSYLRAYLCLHDWLVEVDDTDLSRRLSPYIKPFEEDYIEHVLPSVYHPSVEKLIDDYLHFNPTRNRALDMLPLFAFIDEKRVRTAVDSALVKSRPTYHFRLPDCDIDNPAWGIWKPWNEWAEVEWLAADAERLQDCSQAYLRHCRSLAPDLLNPWRKQVQQWLSTVPE